MLHIIEETVIEALSIHPSLPKDNSYIRLLEEGKKYKQESLTPIYIYNRLEKAFLVTSVEGLDGRYH